MPPERGRRNRPSALGAIPVRRLSWRSGDSLQTAAACRDSSGCPGGGLGGRRDRVCRRSARRDLQRRRAARRHERTGARLVDAERARPGGRAGRRPHRRGGPARRRGDARALQRRRHARHHLRHGRLRHGALRRHADEPAGRVRGHRSRSRSLRRRARHGLRRVAVDVRRALLADGRDDRERRLLRPAPDRLHRVCDRAARRRQRRDRRAGARPLARHALQVLRCARRRAGHGRLGTHQRLRHLERVADDRRAARLVRSRDRRPRATTARCSTATSQAGSTRASRCAATARS